MEILQFATGSVKITLSREDLALYGVDAQELDYTRKEGKRALELVLAVAQAKSGVPLSSGKRRIDCFPCADGGCEIFIEPAGKIRAAGGGALLAAPQAPALYLAQPSGIEEERLLKVLLIRKGIPGKVYADRCGKKHILCSAKVDDPFFPEFGKRVGAYAAYWMQEHLQYIGQIGELQGP